MGRRPPQSLYPLTQGVLLEDEQNEAVWQQQQCDSDDESRAGGRAAGVAWPTSVVVEFNASCISSGAGWHYGWASSRYKATAKHSFRSYTFVPVGSAADGGPTNSSKQRAAAAAAKKVSAGGGLLLRRLKSLRYRSVRIHGHSAS